MAEPVDNSEVTGHLLNKFFEIAAPTTKDYAHVTIIVNEYFNY